MKHETITQRLRRYYRYLLFSIRVYLYEYPMGLDFTMRDATLIRQTCGKLSGYSVTPTSHIKRIFSFVKVAPQDSFLDIGCGKGFVLSKVAALPYRKVTGFDLQSHLIRIAEKNMERLKLQNRVDLSVGDATVFERYGEYNHFFFFNPFDSSVMKPTLGKIIDSLKVCPRDVVLIYYNPTCHDDIMATGCFEMAKNLYDPLKDYNTYIYRTLPNDKIPK